jgi:hypothetical protein
MKFILALTATSALAGLVWGPRLLTPAPDTPAVQAASGRTPQDVYQFAANTKLGAVTFSHANHATKNYNVEGTGPIACVECHHVEQPAMEAAKHPPLKTAWPADRTATLTAESLKDPKTPEVSSCRGCHARAGTKPNLLAENPQIKSEASTAMITLTNQQAFHRNCAGCHDQVVKTRKDASPPTSTKCTACHKK